MAIYIYHVTIDLYVGYSNNGYIDIYHVTIDLYVSYSINGYRLLSCYN